MREKKLFLAWNRGIVSVLGLSRIDLDRLGMSAARMVNWIPRVLGSMMLRPGLGFISGTKSNNTSRLLPFVFSFTDQAQIELTDSLMRVRIDDTLVTRNSVTAAFTNGAFTSNLTGWTDADESGAASTWLTGGYMQLLGTGTNAAIRRQTLAITETGTEHAVTVVIERGPVLFRVGSTSGGEELFTESALDTGTHSLTFTPAAGSAYVEFASVKNYPVLVDSISVEAAGTMELPAIYAGADLGSIRYTQSGDIIYLGCRGYKQQKIERRSTRSWSVVDYEADDGPFESLNTTQTTITSSALSGAVTLTASRGIFKSDHVGAIFRVESTGQQVSSAISGADTFTDPIRVVGIGTQRNIDLVVSGTFTATVTLQYSVGAVGSWVDATTYTTPTTTTYNDSQDNEIIYYRLGIKSGDYTSGTATCSLTFASGSIAGVARVTAYSSATSVSAVVLKNFGGTGAYSDWQEGSWSALRGYPTAVTLYEGRLYWAGFDRIWGSISDSYQSYDPDVIGDSGLIARNIGAGPIQNIHWLMALRRMLLGTAQNSADLDIAIVDGNHPLTARSDSFDVPLTPTNFNLKIMSARGIFVDRSLQRIFEIAYSLDDDDYSPRELSILVPDLNESGIVRLGIQFKPDVRLHCIRNDGKVGMLVYDRAEEVICWLEVETEGTIEDICVLPGAVEDSVYYVVKRTVNGGDVRYVEKWALESECQGGSLNKQADAFVSYTGSATTVMDGLDHLEGEQVIVWADGADVGTKTVSAGKITLSTAATNIVAGLVYTAQWQSSKLASISGVGLNEVKKVNRLGVIAKNTHYQGLKYGPDFDTLYDLPQVRSGAVQSADTIYSDFDDDDFPFGGRWDTDSRLCLQAQAPRPCTLLSSVIEIESPG